jgi:folylpolyglutamate synthase/dihydropteroate synthase
MHITFTYEESTYFDHALKTTTADGAVIEILFKDLDATHFYINDIEYDVNTDQYKGLYVSFGNGLEVVTLPVANVIQQANAQIEGFAAEVEQSQRDEEAMSRELSSPYMTGRI